MKKISFNCTEITLENTVNLYDHNNYIVSGIFCVTQHNYITFIIVNKEKKICEYMGGELLNRISKKDEAKETQKESTLSENFVLKLIAISLNKEKFNELKG